MTGWLVPSSTTEPSGVSPDTTSGVAPGATFYGAGAGGAGVKAGVTHPRNGPRTAIDYPGKNWRGRRNLNAYRRQIGRTAYSLAGLASVP